MGNALGLSGGETAALAAAAGIGGLGALGPAGIGLGAAA